jgi:hypothetical protein
MGEHVTPVGEDFETMVSESESDAHPAPDAESAGADAAASPVVPVPAAGGTATSGAPAERPPTRDSAPQASALWAEQLAAAGGTFLGWLSRPRVRLTVTGVVLLLIGGLFVTSSVWTLPLVIVGVVMVVVAWIGRRLDGRFAVQWGEAGTQLEFRASIKAAEPPPAALPSSSSHALVPAPEREPGDAEIIEGEAHTVEIDVGELKALIAAAQLTEAERATLPDEAAADAIRILRVANGGARASDVSR